MVRKNGKGPIAISVINMKGGVGKSTIAALLCRHAVNTLGLKVLAVDLDPQANVSQAFMVHSYQAFLDEKRPSIVELFKGYIPPSATRRSATALSVDQVAVSVGVGELLHLIPSRFDFSENLVEAFKPNPQVLAHWLADHYQDKDIIIVDCAPTESVLTQAAYHATGLVLVPVKPEYFATIGFPLLQQSLSAFRSKNRSHTIEVAGVVINNAFYDGGNNGGPEKRRALRDIRKEAKANDWKIFDKEIPHSRGFPKLMRGDYSYMGNAWQFRYFAKEFFDSLGMKEAAGG